MVLVNEHTLHFISLWADDLWVDYRFAFMPAFCFVFLSIMAHPAMRIHVYVSEEVYDRALFLSGSYCPGVRFSCMYCGLGTCTVYLEAYHPMFPLAVKEPGISGFVGLPDNSHLKDVE